MDYQRLIEQKVTNNRGFIYRQSNPENNSDAALQASLASMSIASYDQRNELLMLDKDLKRLGLSDMVTTPEEVKIALGIKKYIVDIVRGAVVSALRSREGEKELHPYTIQRMLEREIASLKENTIHSRGDSFLKMVLEMYDIVPSYGHRPVQSKYTN